jgi:enoyl-CoA hydratase
MTVEVSRRGRVLVVELQREEKRNALNAEITSAVDAAMNRLEDDRELWCGVLAGTKKVFSAGADLAAGTGTPTERGGWVGLINRARSKPLVAAVEGPAVGGGLELVLSCDLVVASTAAYFALPEARRGLMPDYGGVFRSARMLPANVARELLLTGAQLTAERAERLGFVNRLVAPGEALEAAVALAEQVCALAPRAIRESLALVNHVLADNEPELWELNDAAHARLVKTHDVGEGIEAFFARRAPVWKDE